MPLEQLVPGHFPLPQRVRHGKNDELVNAIRMSRSGEPCHGGSPVVANDARCVDTERVKNADYIADRVLQGIRGYSFRAIGAPEATQVRRHCVEAIRDEEWDLVTPKIRRVRPPVEQEHLPTAAVVLHMNRNAVDLQHFTFLSRYTSIWSSSSRDGPGGFTASWVPATSMIRSTTPGRAMTSCGHASSDLNSVEARKRSASYVIATRSALAMRAGGSVGCGSGRPSVNALTRAIRVRSISIVLRYQGVTRVSVMESCASVSASGLSRCCRRTSTVPRACMRPMVIPRPSDGFVQAHESPTLTIPVATGTPSTTKRR